MKSYGYCEECGRDSDSDDPIELSMDNPSWNIHRHSWSDFDRILIDMKDGKDTCSIDLSGKYAYDLAEEILDSIPEDTVVKNFLSLKGTSSFGTILQRVFTDNHDNFSMLGSAIDMLDEIYSACPINHPMFPLLQKINDMAMVLYHQYKISPIKNVNEYENENEVAKEENSSSLTNTSPIALTDVLKIEYPGNQFYYDKEDNLHRDDDLPAIDGPSMKAWFIHGQLFRSNDKPSIEWADGSKFWFCEGILHREGNQPAVILANGEKQYWKNGLKHNLFGPSIIINGVEEYYINGKKYEYSEWKRERRFISGIDMADIDL